jgi:hypothetical protein
VPHRTYLQLLVLEEQALAHKGRNVRSPAGWPSAHIFSRSTTGQGRMGGQMAADS